MEAAVAKKHLRWIGHTIQMPEHRLPRQVLYSQQMGAKHSAGGQKRRFKDYTRDILKRANIPLTQLETHLIDQPGRSLVPLQFLKYTKASKTDNPRGAPRDTSGQLVPPWHLVSLAPSADERAAQESDSMPMRSGTSGHPSCVA